MRVWDIDAGFLNDRSLLGEHREIHGLVSVIIHQKTGYSRHPETLRWKSFTDALALRHELLVAEMTLRGFKHRSPLEPVDLLNHHCLNLSWPSDYIDPPHKQYEILGHKYIGKKQGRIPLPRNIQELWARHKYSVMARSYNAYKKYGKSVARKEISFEQLSYEMTAYLRMPTSTPSLRNALFHLWGYVSDFSSFKLSESDFICFDLLKEIQRQSLLHNVSYLIFSTALGELSFRCKNSVSGSDDR
ncbi:MAG: hypothetical protein BWK80_04485 [Desulfobacteraceae bacterium IS3]|nr:MAG: hypothetical protein BWK80_04485 [Desulfobacteraceae bacterium IS3]